MRAHLYAALAFSLFACNKHKEQAPPAAPPPAPKTVAPTPPPAETPEPAKAPDMSRAAGYTTKTIALPGATPDGIRMDYLLFDSRTKAVWVPAGNTGSVDVVDTATGKVSQITGFPTKDLERHGHTYTAGPSSATLGDDRVYVGNRGDSSVCAVDEKKLAKGTCGTLDSMPDGIAYVAKTHEVWVTTPRDKSIRILDAKTLKQKAKLTFDGEPEGFAVDPVRGRFYTNLEDKNQTLAIDLASHKTVSTWQPSCDEHGPHGLRVDDKAGLLFVACSTKVETMDVAHGGAIVGSVDTGDGVDDLDYVSATHRLYAGASRAGTLTVATVDPKGALTIAAVVPTQLGARNGVVDADGNVYLSHAKGSELVVATPPAH
jgi:hypothetical protein